MLKKLTLVQSMITYVLYADENGCMYYVMRDAPQTLVDSGEAVSPDELIGYTFTEMYFHLVEDLNGKTLYNSDKGV